MKFHALYFIQHTTPLRFFYGFAIIEVNPQAIKLITNSPQTLGELEAPERYMYLPGASKQMNHR